MTTLAEHIIVAGAENRPPMLEKSMYDSWASRICLFIKGKKHGRMMLDSIDNAQQLQDDCDVQATNIILYGLPPDVYALVNHQEAAKDIWDRVKMLMKGTELSYQERECRLYNLFDKFAHVPSETLKFVTDVKLAKSLYTTNYDQLYAYLSQHERHANEVRINHERYPDSLAFVANSPTLYNPSQSPQHSAYLPPEQFTSVYAAPIHHQHHHTLQGEDPIECINKAMAFLSAVASRFSPSNNQLRTLSNLRNQATIQDGRVTVQQVQGRQDQSYASTGNRGIATTSKGNVAVGPPRVVKCYNCQGEGHMTRHCTQPKRPRNAAWFKEKLMLAEAQEAGQILDEEQLAFLADLDDLDAYDSNCDDLSSAKVVLMANLSSSDPEVLSKYSEQTHVDDFEDNEIHSGSNIIPYSQYLQETQDAVIQDTNPSAPNDLLVLSLVEQMTNQKCKACGFSAGDQETLSNNVKENESLSKTLTVFKTESKEKEFKYIDKEIILEKQNKELENIICKMYRSTQAMHMLTKPQVFYDDTHKQALGYQNPFHLKKAQRIQPTLYDGSIIAKEHVVISVNDDEETLILEEESRSKMLDKQNDPISIENKINISPIDYSKLNKIKKDFGKRFVTQKELSAEQAFWLKHSSFSETPVTSHTPVRIEAPSELPKSCVNDCNKCLELEIELFKKKDFVENEAYDKLVKSYSNLEKHCISLELATQLNQEIFQRENSGENLNASTFNQLFKINELKARSQEKDTVIRKLKERIKSLSEKDSVENVKKDIDEIETINIELEHSVAKLLSVNENLRKEREHLKSIFKDKFDSIGKTRVQSKEHRDSLIAQINAKSVENSDLNDQLQEKVFAITALKNELRKLKGKNAVNTTVSKPNATLALGIFKLDIKPISPSLKNNRDAHEVYIDKTIEYTDTLRGFVESART
ncbi:retrovirus-related pol polyprotein from transposon TNT 1-94 [Tanacetum coccineum]|uniref:Retrovirus-related pol polyprotein from transposon TNT 1-94 n=1 Tax=Tanacetum coccineum TaxID=301880 RepID=A0ABQ5F660_9ASTR